LWNADKIVNIRECVSGPLYKRFTMNLLTKTEKIKPTTSIGMRHIEWVNIAVEPITNSQSSRNKNKAHKK